MADKDDFRREAARLIEAAKAVRTPEARAAMLELAEQYLKLADFQSPVDFNVVLADYNEQQMGREVGSQPGTQQQQQPQPDKEEC